MQNSLVICVLSKYTEISTPPQGQLRFSVEVPEATAAGAREEPAGPAKKGIPQKSAAATFGAAGEGGRNCIELPWWVSKAGCRRGKAAEESVPACADGSQRAGSLLAGTAAVASSSRGYGNNGGGK